MAKASWEITKRFDQSVSRELLAAVLKCIIEAYRDAYNDCENVFDAPELKNVLPYYRWAKINAALRNIPQTLGVATSAQINKSRNSYHTMLLAGGVQMTASSVEARGQMVRDAVFRKTYAEEAQLFLYEDNTARDESILLYGIILHSPTEDQQEPAFVDIGFPDEGYTQYVGDKIDLFKRFPEVVASFKTPVEETVESEPLVKPRRRTAKKQESA